MMIRLLDIGNTHTRIADWDGRSFSHSLVLETDHLLPLADCAYPMAAACVRPDIQQALEGRNIRFINALEHGSSVDFSAVNRMTLGADRAANAAALAALYPLPGAVIDCGTAITLELVDENKRFIGGAIAPGRALMRKILATGTAQLPETPLATEISERPGQNTPDAITFGVRSAAIGTVREFAAAAERAFSLRSLILTGGDAPFFRQILPRAEVAGEEFTLRGILLCAGYPL